MSVIAALGQASGSDQRVQVQLGSNHDNTHILGPQERRNAWENQTADAIT